MRWQGERDKIAAEGKIKEKLDAARIELEQAQRQGDLAKAGELSYGTIPALEKQLAEAQTVSENALLREEVTAEDIASVVAKWTGVPVERMMQGEREKLLKMEEVIGKRVIGQSDAVLAVSKAVRRARAGLQDPDFAANRSRHHPDTAHQLVFDGQAGIEKWNREFFGPAPKTDPHENLAGTGRFVCCADGRRTGIRRSGLERWLLERRLPRLLHAGGGGGSRFCLVPELLEPVRLAVLKESGE